MIIVVLGVTGSSSFFRYETDCDEGCRHDSLPCTITELSPVQFPCDCITTIEDCKDKAGPRTVCLLPNGSTFGGTDSWIDYYNYTHPIPPTPAPTPAPPTKIQYLQIYAAIVTTILLIYGGSNLIRCVDQIWRRRRYQRLGINQPPSAGIPNTPESPYAATTEEV